VWSCFDNSSPANAIFPANVSVNPSTYAVSFTFTVAQSGYCVVNSTGGYSTTLPNGETASTQSPLDSSNKVATTAYVDSAVAANGYGYGIGANFPATARQWTLFVLTSGNSGLYMCTASPCLSSSQWVQAAFNSATNPASQFYVANTGSDTAGCGAQSTPCATIQNMLSNVTYNSVGAVVHVAAGTYTDLHTCTLTGYTNVNVCIESGGPSSTVRLRLQCDAQWSIPSGSGCLLRNGTKGIVVDQANNVDVVGFDYGNNANALVGIEVVCSSVNGPGNCPTGNSVHVIGNSVHDIASTANDGGTGGTGCPGSIDGGGIVGGRHNGYYMADFQVIGNRVANIGSQTMRTSGSCSYTHGIYPDAPGTIVESNVVINAAANGVQVYSYPCNSIFSNNTIINSGRNSLQIAGADCPSSTPAGLGSIVNNILDGANNYGIMFGTGSGGGTCDASHAVLVSNNNMSGNGSGQTGGSASCDTIQNTTTEAPATSFVSYSGTENDDLHLKSGSVLIGAGTTSCVTGGPTPCTPSTALDGVTRPNPPSAGAYE
jgi:hypothetical protein